MITGKELFNLLGSFWTTVVKTKGFVLKLLNAAVRNNEHTEVNSDRFLASFSAEDIQPGKVIPWLKLEISEATQSLRQYDGSAVYGSRVYYGDVDNTKYIYTIDNKVISINYLYDSLTKPTVVLTEGIDFLITEGHIQFFSKPVAEVFYARNVLLEDYAVNRQLGHALQVSATDKLYTQVSFKHIWRLYTYGSTYEDLFGLLSEICQVPVFKQTERVENILYKSYGTFIVTANNVYYIPSGALVTVTRYKTYNAGDTMCDKLQLVHNKQSKLPASLYNPAGTLEYYQYGKNKYKADALVLIKAEPKVNAGALLSLLKNVLPVEIGIIVIASKVATKISSNELNAGVSNTINSNHYYVAPFGISEDQTSIRMIPRLKVNYGI